MAIDTKVTVYISFVPFIQLERLWRPTSSKSRALMRYDTFLICLNYLEAGLDWHFTVLVLTGVCICSYGLVDTSSFDLYVEPGVWICAGGKNYWIAFLSLLFTSLI